MIGQYLITSFLVVFFVLFDYIKHIRQIHVAISVIATFLRTLTKRRVVKLKIVLIEPTRRDVDMGSGKLWLYPSWIKEIAGMTSEEHEIIPWIEAFNGKITPENLPNADICGIGGLSPSYLRAQEIAGMIKERGLPLIAGGMHVIGCFIEGRKEELLRHFGSIVVTKLTPRLWQEILIDSQSSDGLKQIYKMAINEPFCHIVPRHDMVPEGMVIAPRSFQSSFGCLHNCPWCCVNQALGDKKKIYCKPTEIIRQELELMGDGFKVDLPDDWGANTAHSLNLLPILSGNGPFFTEISAAYLAGGGGNQRPELLDPMCEAGFKYFYIGFEHPFVKLSDKSLKREEYEKLIRRLHQKNRIIIGSFMLDATGRETRESVRDVVKWTIDQGIHFVQFSLVVALPGTALRKRAVQRGELIDYNPEHSCGGYPTIYHPNLSGEERMDLIAEAYGTFYSLRTTPKRVKSFSQILPVLFGSYKIGKSLKKWRSKVNGQYWKETRHEHPI